MTYMADHTYMRYLVRPNFGYARTLYMLDPIVKEYWRIPDYGLGH